MYKCNNCAHEFQHYDTITENTGEKHYVCPRCRGTDFDEAKVCELCGDWFVESEHNEICQSCINIIVARFKELFHANFTPFERSVINSAYDGRNLE